MRRKHNESLVPFAKELRRNMTREERHLWYDFLKDYPLRFSRQKVLGGYIVDFYCAEAKLAVELDGSQHYEPEGLQRDLEKSEFLMGYDIQVIHIANCDVSRNFRAVCEMIDAAVKQSLSHLR